MTNLLRSSFLTGALGWLLLVPASAGDPDPPGAGVVGGVAKPANQPPEVAAVPGPHDRLTDWRQAATAPGFQTVEVAGLLDPDGRAVEEEEAAPVMVLDEKRAEFPVTLAFSGGLTLVTLRGELPEGPTAADYAGLARANADRLRHVRPLLAKSEMIELFQNVTGKEAELGPGGVFPVVRYVVLYVRPDKTTPDADDVLVAPHVSFSLRVKGGGERIVLYDHNVFGMPPSSFERWVWRSPADDPEASTTGSAPADPDSTRAEAADQAGPATTAAPGDDENAPRFVRTRGLSREGIVTVGMY